MRCVAARDLQPPVPPVPLPVGGDCLVTEVTEIAFDEELDNAVLAFVPPGTAPDPP